MKALMTFALFSTLAAPAFSYDLESLMSPSQKILLMMQMKQKLRGNNSSKSKRSNLDRCKEHVSWAKKNWVERKDDFGLSEAYVVNGTFSKEEIEGDSIEPAHRHLDFLNKYFPGFSNKDKFDHSFSYMQTSPHTYDSCKKYFEIGDVDVIKVNDNTCRKSHIIIDESENYHVIICANDNTVYIDFNEYTEDDIEKRIKPLVKKD